MLRLADLDAGQIADDGSQQEAVEHVKAILSDPAIQQQVNQ